jgi:hypothetical protein
MAMTKSKLQMEYNKKVTSSAPGLLYVFFGSFVSDQRFEKEQETNLKSLLYINFGNYI